MVSKISKENGYKDLIFIFRRKFYYLVRDPTVIILYGVVRIGIWHHIIPNVCAVLVSGAFYIFSYFSLIVMSLVEGIFKYHYYASLDQRGAATEKYNYILTEELSVLLLLIFRFSHRSFRYKYNISHAIINLTILIQKIAVFLPATYVVFQNLWEFLLFKKCIL